MDQNRLAALKFRAWHRGTREADYMIGGFFDRYHATWGEAEVAWFEALIEEDDVDIMAWVLGTLLGFGSLVLVYIVIALVAN